MAAVAQQDVPTRSFPLRDRRFAALWTGAAISVLGDLAFDTTLVLWVASSLAYGQSWAPLAVSGLLVAASAPIALVGPVAGVFADRWQPRTTMLGADALRAVLVGLLLVSLAVPLGTAGRLVLAYVVVALSATTGQFFLPSRMTVVASIVPEEQQPAASGLLMATQPLASVLGPAIAAPLYFAVGPAPALAANALSFALSFLCVVLAGLPVIPRTRVSTSSFRGEMTEGWAFFRKERTLMTLLVVGVVIMLGAGAINALDVFFVRQNLHAPLSLYGLLTAVFGVGAVVGAVVVGPLLVKAIGLVRTLVGCLVLVACGMLIYSRLTSFPLAAAVLFLTAIPMMGFNTAVQPLLFRVTPQALLGRVSSVLMPAIEIASILSMVLAGVLVSTVLHGFHADLAGVRLGPIDTVFTVGGILGLAGAAYAAYGLRNVEGRARTAQI